MKDSAADMQLLAADAIELIEELMVLATDPAERQQLEDDYDLALKVLELATKRAEEEAAKTRLAESIAAAEQRRESRELVRANQSARRWLLKQKLEREWRAEGVRQVKQQGLDRWLKPR